MLRISKMFLFEKAQGGNMPKKPKIDEDEVLEQAIKRFDDEVSLLNEEYTRMEEDLKFARNYDESMWDQRILVSRRNSESFRPCLTVNKISEKIRTVLGEFEQLDPAVTISPVDNFADPVIAEILSGLVKHVEANSKAKMVYKTSYSNTLNSGIGGWKIDLKQDPIKPETSHIIIKSIANPFQVRWDPNAKEYDKSDARYVFFIEDIPKEDFEEQYPDVDTSGWSHYPQSDWLNRDTVKVAEYWWKDKIKDKLLLVNRQNQKEYIFQDEILPDDEILSDKAIDVERDKIYYGKIVHTQFIEGPFDDWPLDRFPFVFQGGDFSYIDGLTRYYGLVNDAKEAQQMYNYFISSTVEQVVMQPKAPYVADAKSIEGFMEYWQDPNSTDLLVYDSKGGTTPAPTRNNPPVLSQGLSGMLDIANKDLMSSMGIYESNLGMQGPEVSGVAINSRQRQGSLATHPYIDNFECSLTYSAQLIIDLIPYVYDTERIVRILGPDSKEKIVMINTTVQKAQQMQLPQESHIVSPSGFINDLKNAGRYDVVVNIGPSHTTMRQENLAMMIDLLKTLPNMADTLAPILIKYIDTPAAQEVSKTLSEKAQNQQTDPVVQVAQADVQRKSQADQMKYQLDQMKLQMQEQNEAHKREIEEIKAITDMYKAGLDARSANRAEVQLGLDEQDRAIRNQIEMEKMRQAQQAQQAQQMQQAQRTQQTSQPGPGQGINIPSTPTPQGGLE